MEARVFVDTFYWVAVTNPRDPWKAAARAARARLTRVRLVTTEEVLSEFLTAFAAAGVYLRKQAVEICQAILSDPEVTVIPQSHMSFLHGLQFYQNRIDKQYSLADYISMNVMRAEAITDVLTNTTISLRKAFRY